MIGEVGHGKELEALAASQIRRHMSREDTDMVHFDRPYNLFICLSLLSWSWSVMVLIKVTATRKVAVLVQARYTHCYLPAACHLHEIQLQARIMFPSSSQNSNKQLSGPSPKLCVSQLLTAASAH